MNFGCKYNLDKAIIEKSKLIKVIVQKYIA